LFKSVFLLAVFCKIKQYQLKLCPEFISSRDVSSGGKDKIMQISEKLLNCPVCTFPNTPSFNNCEICGTSLKNDENINSASTNFEDNKVEAKKNKKNWLTKFIYTLAALLIGSYGVKVILQNPSIGSTLFLQQSVLNKHGDIKLHNTMSEVPNIPEGIFNYGGAICFAALRRDGMNTAISDAFSQFQLRYVEPVNNNPGCTTGIQQLLDRDLTIAQNSRPLTEAELASAKLRGFELESIPIAIDGVVFYINKSLGVKSLSLEEIRAIYRGRITNWQELGGKNIPVKPISLDPQVDSILRLLMKTNNPPLIDEKVEIVRDYTSAIRKTSATPGAISYASAAIVRGQQSIKPIALAPDKNSPAISGLLADGSVNQKAFKKNFYPLTRPLSIVFRRDGSPQERAAVAYINLLISEEGQKIVEQAGMVPMYYNR